MLFKQIRLMKQRHETTRLLINDLELRYLRLLKEVREMQESDCKCQHMNTDVASVVVK